MAFDIAYALKLDIRNDSRRAFIAAVRQIEQEYRNSPPGGVKHGGVGGGGRVPRDTGATQSSLRTSNWVVASNPLHATVTVTANRAGFDYPSLLDRGGRGRRTSTGRSARGRSSGGGIHTGWWNNDWWNAGPGGDRWGTALQQQMDRIS